MVLVALLLEETNTGNFSDEQSLVRNFPNYRSTFSVVWSDLSQVGRGFALMRCFIGRLVYVGGAVIIMPTRVRLLFLDML